MTQLVIHGIYNRKIIFIRELIRPMALRFFNTLTKKKELFEPDNNTVRWYICGPTVYDSPHIGHARTYVCFDAVRRVLEGYFGFNVLYVMNITDVDDKIINKARESFSFDKKLQNIEITKNSNLKSNKNECELAEFTRRCAEITRKYELEFFNDLEQLCVQPPTFVTRVSEYMDVINDFIKNLVHKEMAYTSNGSVYFDIEAYRRKFTYPQFVDKSAVCDEENPAPLNSHGANTTSFHEQSEISRKDSHPVPQNNDNAIVNQISRKDPNPSSQNNDNAIVNEILRKDPNPSSQNNDNAIVNEISRKDFHPFPQNNDNAISHEISRKDPNPLSQNTPIEKELKPNVDSELQKTDKRSPIDFALWKSRNTDLYYESPFGNGRPGWHIECSAMAHSIFQKGMDIHSGGIDLAFPHHENEMAQSQAITETKWVKTWLHTGHLHIDGLKMSKSLKNFITIRDFLKKYTPRQIRFAFLIQQWWKPMVFSDLFMKNAVNTEKKLFTLLSNLQSRVSKEYVQNCCFDTKSQKHLQTLDSFKQKVHESFCDNVDTCGVLKVLQELASYYYAEEQNIPVFLVKPIFEFVKRILDLLGLFSIESENTSGNNEVLLDILNSYRNEIRDLCKKKADFKAFYTASDAVRDELKKHNIVMEDTKNNTSSIRKIN